MKSTKQVSTPPPKKGRESLDFAYADFEVVRERWNKYKLEDNSTLKTKFVLINVTLEKTLDEAVKEFEILIEKGKKPEGLKMGLGFQSKNIMGIEAPRRLRGDPSSKTHKTEELRASIVKDDLDFEVLEETWNSYKVKNGITLKIRNSPINVSRTSKFDVKGTPIYVVDFRADIKMDLPTRVKEIIKKKR